MSLFCWKNNPTTAVEPGTSTTNAIANALKFTSVTPPVYSPAWSGVKRATVVREMFTTGTVAEPDGLPVDGTFDGEWQVRVTPVDMAGNRGEVKTSTFTYDTIPPELSLYVITNDELIASDTLVTSGTCSDNNKTDHDDGQGIAKVKIRLEAVDSWGLTTMPALIDWTEPPMPLNLEILPAETVIKWSFEERIPAYTGRGRLIVKAVDLAGNETQLVRELQIQSGPIEGTNTQGTSQ